LRITQKPYPVSFAHKEVIEDSSDHLSTYIYSFTSLDNNQRYIIRAEHHAGDVFGIKFYAKNHELSKSKYQIITNYQYPVRVFITCASIIPILSEAYPNASFGFIGARSIKKGMIIENLEMNIRFKIYTEHIPQLISDKLFEHYEYPTISSYLIVNKNHDLDRKKLEIEEMFFKNYRNVHAPFEID